jgi:hypothetical protein
MKVVNTYLVTVYQVGLNIVPIYECVDQYGNHRWFMSTVPGSDDLGTTEIQKYQAENLIFNSNF